MAKPWQVVATDVSPWCQAGWKRQSRSDDRNTGPRLAPEIHGATMKVVLSIPVLPLCGSKA